MEIKEIIEMQRELDAEILRNLNKYSLVTFKDSDFLTEKILALQVEVSELANATRCFKYWSKKKSEPKERLLDEYADCLHFLLSIANTLGFTAEEIEQAYIKKHEVNYKRQEEGY